jgi:acylphosphatase
VISKVRYMDRPASRQWNGRISVTKVRVHIWVTGRVQGVYFRYAVEEEAGDHGITGWVRNLPDGRVEGIFEGDEPDVQEILTYCRKGPQYAKVDHVEVREEPFRGEFRGFEIRY